MGLIYHNPDKDEILNCIKEICLDYKEAKKWGGNNVLLP